MITLLTDFGTADGYVAALKGVIRTIAPDVIIDDASHDVPPGDIYHAAWTLAAYAFRYPPDTVHVIVVDPGVGSARRAIAATVDGRHFVCPDNGIITRVIADCKQKDVQVNEITNRALLSDAVSTTFHGRDIFAPAAAHIARGLALDELGPQISDPVLLQLPEPYRDAHSISGEVVYVDVFGNLITNIPADWLQGFTRVYVGEHEIPIVRTYSDVPDGAALALVGSRGVLELSVRNGHASIRLRAQPGVSCSLGRRSQDT